MFSRATWCVTSSRSWDHSTLSWENATDESPGGDATPSEGRDGKPGGGSPDCFSNRVAEHPRDSQHVAGTAGFLSARGARSRIGRDHHALSKEAQRLPDVAACDAGTLWSRVAPGRRVDCGETRTAAH